ncbi:MAG: YesL family protein [Eubacteriales bacterium]|nr:YesL family protein [Eubacteriales bacterium]MDD4475482.1 YesL family protein [Eubacteriales bacterium]
MGKLFNFFSGNSTKERKEISKEEAKKLKNLNFANFFKLLGVRFNNIVKGNGLFLLCNIPILFAVYATAGYHNIKTRVPTDLFFPNVYGATVYEGNNAVTAALNGLFGFFTNFSVPSTTTIILYLISFLCIFTFGLSNAGLTYLMRESVRSNVVMAWSDFWSTIKKNFKQCLFIGVFDIIVIFLLVYDLVVFYQTSNDTTGAIGFTAILLLSFTYLIMRNYIYLIAITFDFKFKVIMNYSFRLSLLGIKRNLAGVVGIVVVIILNFIIAGFALAIGLILPFIITIGICAFIGAYTAWPVVEKYLVDVDAEKKKKTLYEYYDFEDDVSGEDTAK